MVLAKWLSVRLRTKWLWVRVQLQSPINQVNIYKRTTFKQEILALEKALISTDTEIVNDSFGDTHYHHNTINEGQEKHLNTKQLQCVRKQNILKLEVNEVVAL